ncbi:MAG: phytanoyl-CoA dioxygenase family protein [Candidatus Handelsmanbacteria bacterium]|nr:phytanoyl-CoA dioxygenase family protein [Candidatus Handelsmanbacteria bacterium]
MTAPTTAARAAYESDGYYISQQPVLPVPVVAGAKAGMDEVRAGRYDTGVAPQPSVWKPGDDEDKLCKIEMPQVASRPIWDLVSHPALGEWAAALSGAAWVQVWWVQLLYKPPVRPQVSTNVGWHQDRHYWQVWEAGSELFTAWVALEEVGADSGPMRFVRGSHRWGFLDQSDFFGQDLDGQRRGLPLPAGASWSEDEVLLPAGGASFHHCLTLHGSGANTTGRARRSFAIHLRTEKSRPVEDRRAGLTAFIDNPHYCPLIYPRSV